MSFWLMIIFSVLHLLGRPQKPVRLQPPAVLKVYVQTALEIYGFLGGALLLSFAARFLFPAWADWIGMILFLALYASAKYRRHPEYFAVMVFVCWAFLSLQAPAEAFAKAALMSLGVPFFEWGMDGLRFRLAFSPAAKRFSTLPGLLLLASLVTLVLSCFSR